MARKSKSASRSSSKSSRAMNTLEAIPTPKANAQQVTALVKSSGRITGYQLSGGKTLGKSDAVQLARKGGISGVGISSRNGSEYLKAIPGGAKSKTLGSLPTV